MPTVITHAAVPLAAAFALGPQRVPLRLAVAGTALAMVPDLDVLTFKFGVAYADEWGHRGATHSLAFAALLASGLALCWRALRSVFAWMFLFLSASSHGLLDMLTDGGLGIALYWPIENARHFFTATPIRVSPIGGGFFSSRGLEAVMSELVWVWLPFAALALGLRAIRRRKAG